MSTFTRYMLAAVALAAVFCAGQSSFAADRRAKDGPAEPAEEKFLRETEARIDRLFLMAGGSLEAALECALFDPAPLLNKAKDLARKGPEPLRPRAVALMARIERIAQNDPEAALAQVAGVLLDKERRQAWEKAFAEGRDAALDKWKEESAQARRDRVEPPAKPGRMMFAPFPVIREWSIDSNSLRCAVEAGLCLLALNDRQAALQVFKTIGEQHSEDLIAVLSEEGGGDAFMMPGGYAKAVDLFSHAIQVCRHCIGYMQADPFGEIRHFQSRIERKLAEARRLSDIEAFGPGYCAYRHAQDLRCNKKDYLNAFLAYEDLAWDYPRTVFSAASEAYRLKLLLELSESGNESAARTAVTEVEKAYLAAEAKLKAAEQEQPIRKDRELRDTLRETLKQQHARLQRMKGIPLGARAAREAAGRERELLKDEFALYRGEVLVDLATHAFERDLDPVEAERRYQKAWAWLEKVDSVDAALDAYDVPEKARKVSAPPPTEDKMDPFGNIKRTDPPSDSIVNRRTCKWYLNDLREKCALAIGFLHFHGKKSADSLAWYQKVLALDRKTGYLQKAGEWNNYKRLRWGAEHGFLYAHPDELKLYQKRQRFVILMADFYYVTERFDKAAELYRRFLSGELGKAGGALSDYPQYALAACTYWTGGRQKAFAEYLKVLAKREGTFTEDRAAYAAGNISADIGDKTIREQGLGLLQELAKSERDNEFVWQAMIASGTRLIESGEMK